jgi:hypothetical protein
MSALYTMHESYIAKQNQKTTLTYRYVWYIRHFSCFCGVSVVFRLVSYQDRPHVDILGGDLIEPSVSVKIRVGPASQKRRKSLELPGCTTCFQVLVLESPPKFAVIASTTVVTDYY